MLKLKVYETMLIWFPFKAFNPKIQIQIQIQNAEIEEEARSKHIARLDFFKTIRASVEEVGDPHSLVNYDDDDGA